jgi:ABC-type Fe3+/spermidine/putrescine transport system ATPase subunit
MREEIRKIQKRAGITALYVTHDQEEALSISDQVAVMHSGRISQLDRPYTVYENPESVLVADFIGRANFVDARLTEVSDRVNRVRVGESHLTLAATANRHGLKAGAEAVLFFRPERATLTAEAPADNYLPVTVRHLLYLGETVRYFVMLGEVELVISQNRRVDGLEVGGQGYLELGPEDARLFPAEQKRLLKGGN